MDIATRWISAYADYDVILHKLAITAVASPSLIITPQAAGKIPKIIDPERMNSMTLLAEVFADKRLLSSGAGKMAYWIPADY